jgi:hypothetical protein
MSEYFAFLDSLRESGQINMLGAPSVLQEAFDLPRQEARDIVKSWMEQFGK